MTRHEFDDIHARFTRRRREQHLQARIDRMLRDAEARDTGTSAREIWLYIIAAVLTALLLAMPLLAIW